MIKEISYYNYIIRLVLRHDINEVKHYWQITLNSTLSNMSYTFMTVTKSNWLTITVSENYYQLENRLNKIDNVVISHCLFNFMGNRIVDSTMNGDQPWNPKLDFRSID